MLRKRLVPIIGDVDKSNKVSVCHLDVNLGYRSGMLLWTDCAPQTHTEILIPSVMVLGSGALGRW